jgi:ABC-2 type transport system permease protein
MSNVWTIARKEFAAYFNAPIAYIVIVLFLVVTSVLFFFPQGFFIVGQASLRAFFALLPWTLVFFIPPITMRLFAEEKKLGTIEVLMTLPIRDHEAVLGKFLGAYGFVLAMLAFTLSLPLTVAWLGDPDPGPILGGYAGALLLAASYVAIGLFVSSLTENQIIAFIVSAVALVALVLIGDQGMLAWLPASAVPFIQYLSLSTHFESLGRGVIDTRDVVYYLSTIGFFLTLTVWSVENGKWR